MPDDIRWIRSYVLDEGGGSRRHGLHLRGVEPGGDPQARIARRPAGRRDHRGRRHGHRAARPAARHRLTDTPGGALSGAGGGDRRGPRPRFVARCVKVTSSDATNRPLSGRSRMPKLTAEQERLCEESRWDFSDLRALYINCTLKRSPEVSNTQGLADRSIAIMRAQRRRRGDDPRRRPRDRHRRLPGHDRARLGARRLAGDLREGPGRRHPGAHLADLAGREVIGLHAGHRAPVRQQPPAQRGRGSTPTTVASAAA